MKAKKLVLCILGVFLLYIKPLYAFAADTKNYNSLVVFYPVDDKGKPSSDYIWGGFIVEGADGTQYVISSIESAQDGESSNASYYVAMSDTEKTKIALVIKDKDSGIALYSMKNPLSDKISISISSISDISSGDSVTVYGFNWSNYKSSIKEIYSYYETSASGFSEGEEDYKFLVIDKASDKGWGGSLVCSSEGQAIGVLTCKNNMDYVLPIDYLYGALGYSSSENPSPTGTETTKYNSNYGGMPVNVYKVVFFTLIVIVTIVLLVLIVLYKKKSSHSDEKNMTNGNYYYSGGTPFLQKSLCIIGQNGLYAGQRFFVNDKITIGRNNTTCNLCYPKDIGGVSGIHCQVRPVGNQLELLDMGSSYGTYCRGSKLLPNVPVILSIGESFYLAGPENTFIVSR